MEGTEVNVDDLFNEDDLEQAALAIPLPVNDVVEAQAQPVSLESKLRLDDLHVNGCRQRVAWSRMGCVASISSDSTSVGIQCLRLNRRTAAWELSSKYNLDLPVDENHPHLYTHLCWNSTGSDLSLFDNRGRVVVFGLVTGSAINRYQDLGYMNPDNGNKLKRVVGTFWLPTTDREIPAISQLTKQDEFWAITLTRRKPTGPNWLRALLFVTRLGILRLLYMKADRQWHESSAVLYHPSSSKDLLTHAAFAPTIDGSIFITTHTIRGTMSTYSLQVNRPNQEQMATMPITLHIEHISSNICVGSLLPVNTDEDLMGGTTPNNSDSAILSHLEIIPTTDIDKAVQVPPTIFAITTTYTLTPGISNSLQPKSSIIHRWSLYTVPQTLHPRFDEIPIKGTVSVTANPNMIKSLQRLPDVRFDGIITSMQLVDSNSALAITTLDGTTSFYNPSTMSPVFYESSSREITSLSQAGFAFPPTADPFSLAFSPSACAAVSIASTSNEASRDQQSDKLTLNFMSHHFAMESSSDSNLDPALASLILAYTRACYNASSTDDILACIRSTLQKPHIPQLEITMLGSLFRPGDFIRSGENGSELDKLAQKLLVPKCLSLFAVLDYQTVVGGENNDRQVPRRNTPARYAWIVLLIRQVAMQLFYVANSVKSPEPLPGEIVRLTCDSIAWVFELFRLIIDELCAIDDGEPEADTGIRELVRLLLAGVWSRYFLKMVEKVLRMFNQGGGAMPEIIGAVQDQTGKGLTMFGVGFLLEAAERLSRANPSGAREEMELLAAGESKQVGAGLLERLVKDFLPNMRKSGDVDKLAVYTNAVPVLRVLLEDGDVDIHRKTSVKGKGKGEIRRCVRCAGVSIDVSGPKREWPKWIQQQIMRCVCEGNFWVEGREE